MGLHVAERGSVTPGSCPHPKVAPRAQGETGLPQGQGTWGPCLLTLTTSPTGATGAPRYIA